MEFYKSVFGGKLTIQTFKDFGMQHDPADADKVMHGMLEAPNGITFMGADTPSNMTYQEGARISIALSGDNAGELGSYFDKLATGGKVTVPLAKAPWGDTFGMLTDRYNVMWMVNIAVNKS
jgi:PhnB protein